MSDSGFEPRQHSLVQYQSRRSEMAGGTFVGGYTRRVTPVPIPNTVVKPAGPMILLQRESRSLPALYKDPRSQKDRGFFCAPTRLPFRLTPATPSLSVDHSKTSEMQ